MSIQLLTGRGTIKPFLDHKVYPQRVEDVAVWVGLIGNEWTGVGGQGLLLCPRRIQCIKPRIICEVGGVEVLYFASSPNSMLGKDEGKAL